MTYPNEYPYWGGLDRNARRDLRDLGLDEQSWNAQVREQMREPTGLHFTQRGVGDTFIPISETDSAQRQDISAYHNAVKDYLNGRDDGSRIEEFRGYTIAGHEFETDLEVIEYLALAGELGWEEMYEQ